MEAKEEKKKEEWTSQLVIVDEKSPPQRVYVKGKEVLDESVFLAKMMNTLEKIEAALTQ